MAVEKDEFKMYLSVLAFLEWSIYDFTWDLERFPAAPVPDKPLIELPDNPKDDKRRGIFGKFLYAYIYGMLVVLPIALTAMLMMGKLQSAGIIKTLINIIGCYSQAYLALFPIYMLGGWCFLELVCLAGVALAITCLFIEIFFYGFDEYDLVCKIFLYGSYVLYYMYFACGLIRYNINFDSSYKKYLKEKKRIEERNEEIRLENKRHRDAFYKRKQDLMTFPKMDRELLDELLNITDVFLLKGAEYKIKYYTEYVFDYSKADTPEECYQLEKSGYENYFCMANKTFSYMSVESYNSRHNLTFRTGNGQLCSISYLFSDLLDHKTKLNIVRLYIDYVKRMYHE